MKLELSKIKHDFTKINGSPNWVYNLILQQVIEYRETVAETSNSIESNTAENTNKVHTISLPYNDKKSRSLMTLLNSTLVYVLPDRHVTRFAYTGKKLGSFFSTKGESTLVQTYLLHWGKCCKNVLCNL